MKTAIVPVSLVLFASIPAAYADSQRDHESRPCFRVNIQNHSVNTARIRQSCDMNFSRTMQAGRENRTYTVQTGRVNDNKVRQYQYDTTRYFHWIGPSDRWRSMK